MKPIEINGEEYFSATDLIRSLGIARQTLWQLPMAYTTAGDSGLAARKRGPKGGGGKLKGWQAAAICNLIRDHHPEQLKLVCISLFNLFYAVCELLYCLCLG